MTAEHTALKNGDLLVFNTAPSFVATIVGIYENAYAFLFMEGTTMDSVRVKKISHAQLEKAVADRLIDPPVVLDNGPKSTPKPKKRQVNAGKAPVKKKPKEVTRPPWAS